MTVEEHTIYRCDLCNCEFTVGTFRGGRYTLTKTALICEKTLFEYDLCHCCEEKMWKYIKGAKNETDR